MTLPVPSSVPRPNPQTANPPAMRAIRAILDAAHNFGFDAEGTLIDVSVDRLPAPPWPAAGVAGLSQDDDGPWPSPTRLRCTWPTGSVVLVMEARYWRTHGAYRHLVVFRTSIPAARRGGEVLSITFALAIHGAENGEAIVKASFTPFRKRGAPKDPTFALARAARDVVVRAGLPMASEFQVEACRVRMPEGLVMPSPVEVFKRLAMLSVLKVPFFRLDGDGVEGEQPFRMPAAVDGALPTANLGGKRAGLTPLPGGVRQYKQTLDALLGDLQKEPMSVERFNDLLGDRYEISGETARKSYLAILTHLHLCAVALDRIEITPDGQEYLQRCDALDLFERFHKVYAGMLEVLVIVGVLGRANGERISEALQSLLGTRWETSNQVSFRRNWLLSLGLVERTGEGDSLTLAGQKVLDLHVVESDALRARLNELFDELSRDDDEETDEEDEAGPAPGLEAPRPIVRDEPSAWRADRVDLGWERIERYTKLALPKETLARAAAALSSGKHLLLVGPPGTGKTELAHALIDAATAEGYCAGAHVATASADWTTFDTIGGYAVQKDGSLRFRSGALLLAIERWKWLVIDELNRADVDRAFGELMTVLSGRTVDTAYKLDDDSNVRIGSDADASHPMPKTFRVLATMNTWDKTSLFRLSYAVQRRFAVVYVNVPDDAAYGALVLAHAGQPGFDRALESASAHALADLFSSRGLLAVRAVGPAVALDVVRYVRRRSADEPGFVADAVSEALAMFVLPQLEGLAQEDAVSAYRAMIGTIGAAASRASGAELRERFVELFPHVRFPADAG